VEPSVGRKTLSDSDAGKVNFQPVPATITQLGSLPSPPHLPNDRRIAPVEFTSYAVRARLVEFKGESDDDFHLVVAEPGDRSKTMVAEIPAPGYSQAQALLGPPRREFVDLFGRVPLSWSWSQPRTNDDLVQITVWVFTISTAVKTASHRMRLSYILYWPSGGHQGNSFPTPSRQDDAGRCATVHCLELGEWQRAYQQGLRIV
jgi:hypothetical protein